MGAEIRHAASRMARDVGFGEVHPCKRPSPSAPTYDLDRPLIEPTACLAAVTSQALFDPALERRVAGRERRFGGWVTADGPGHGRARGVFPVGQVVEVVVDDVSIAEGRGVGVLAEVVAASRRPSRAWACRIWPRATRKAASLWRRRCRDAPGTPAWSRRRRNRRSRTLTVSRRRWAASAEKTQGPSWSTGARARQSASRVLHSRAVEVPTATSGVGRTWSDRSGRPTPTARSAGHALASSTATRSARPVEHRSRRPGAPAGGLARHLDGAGGHASCRRWLPLRRWSRPLTARRVPGRR